MSYTRRTELTCTQAELTTYADKVLLANELLAVVKTSGRRDIYYGDGTTPISGLSPSVSYDELNALKTAAETAKMGAATSEANAASSAQAAANSAASLVVVNDLVTGGTDKALSAEQGKVLNTSISELSVDLGDVTNQLMSDIPVNTKTGVARTIEGKVTISTNVDTWTYSIVDISDCINKTLSITTGSDRPRPIIFADDNGTVISTYIHDTGNQNLMWDIDVDVPDGATLLYVNHPNSMELPLSISGLKKRDFARIDEVPEEIVVEQTTGTSQTAVMSQNAVTNAIKNIKCIVSENYLNPSDIQMDKNFIVGGDGVFKYLDSPGKANTGLIHVPYGEKYISFQYEDEIYNINRSVAFDSSGDVIEYNTYAGPYHEIPDGTDTIILNIANGSLLTRDDARVVFSKEYVEFQPFQLENVTDLPRDIRRTRKEIDENVLQTENKFDEINNDVRSIDYACDQYVCNAMPGIDFSERDEEGNKKWRGTVLLNKIYSLYDELVEDYPEYVSKRQDPIAIISNPNNEETYPIYVYDFKPIGYRVGLSPTAPKFDNYPTIIYTSGTHGGEGTSIIDGFSFFRELCNNWQSSKILQDMRFGVRFVVVPIVNPYGVVAGTRKNENGVDLNRNFSNGWRGDITDPDHINYPGTEPASEISTKAIENLIDNTPHIFGIDHHINGTCFGSDPICVGYTVSHVRESSLVYSIAEWISAQVLKKLPSYVTTDAYINDRHIPYKLIMGSGDGAGYLYAKYKRGFVFESVTGWGYTALENPDKGTEREREKSSHQFSVENIATIMYTAWITHHRH